MAFKEIELNNPVNLCDQNGHLNPQAVGFSRTPLHTCNLKGFWPRKKRWNYWCITTPDYLFSITHSNIDYLGMAFAYYLDFSSKRFIEQTVMVPLGRGFVMNETVQGELHYNHSQMKLDFVDQGEKIELRVDSPNFGGLTLKVDLQITRPVGHETLNVVIPWSLNRFQFTSKQQCLPVTGKVCVGNEGRVVENAFACLDFGRGIWPYQSFWNWSAFSGLAQGHTVGMNLGAGWTDGTGLNENGLVIDGRLEKLHEDAHFSYDRKNYMKTWRLQTTQSKKIDLEFNPFYERIARTDLFVLRSEVHQMIGYFNGMVQNQAGENIAISNLVGWAEDHQARW